MSPPHTDPSSDSSRPTPTAENPSTGLRTGFELTGRSNPPDPRFNAYRPDLADVALAGRVIASHYAAPISKTVVARAPLRVSASKDSEEIAEVEPEDTFSLLDDTLGWAWGYAGRDRRVGYVRLEALGG